MTRAMLLGALAGELLALAGLAYAAARFGPPAAITVALALIGGGLCGLVAGAELAREW